MLFYSKSEQQRLDAIDEKFAADENSLLLSAPEYLAIDPQHATALNAVGKDALQKGDIEAAIRWLWQAVEVSPLDPANYALLAQAYESDAATAGYAGHFWLTGLWLTACAESVRSWVSDAFEPLLDEEDEEQDPETYAAVAEAREEEFRSRELPEELRARFRPYQLVQELARGLSEGAYHNTIGDPIKAAQDLYVPIWRAAVRSWARFEGDENPQLVAMCVAFLGEYAGTVVLGELWELTLLSDEVMFRHGHWAVWRMGQRFPNETLANITAQIPDASVGLRCGMAEHLDLMSRSIDVKPALLELVADFSGIAEEADAPYLLLAVFHALEGSGQPLAAKELLARHKRSLPKGARGWFEDNIDEFIPRIVEEDIQAHDIEQVAFMGALMESDDDVDEFTEEDDRWGDEDDDDCDDDDEDEPIVKPGRNDPCWCGSGKKYKKCHLEADEEAERNAPEEDENDFTANEAMEGLLSTAQRSLTPREMEMAGRLFFGKNFDREEVTREASVPFLFWFILDYECPSVHRTAIEEHLLKHGSHLDANVLELLETWRDSTFDMFEVTGVDTGKRITITNVFTGEEIQLPDSTASPTDIEGMMFARVAIYREQPTLMADAISVPRDKADALRALIETEAKAAGVPPAEFIQANTHRWHRVVREL